MTTATTQLYQITDATFGDERFCFHAADQKDAERRLSGWCSYHGFDTDTRRSFSVAAVDSPKYTDNIHDEWVD